MLEEDTQGDEPEPKESILECRVWGGTNKSLNFTVPAGGFKVTSTIGGRKFAVLYPRDQRPILYRLTDKTPISVEYHAAITPQQGDLRAVWVNAQDIYEGFFIPHQTATFIPTYNQLCHDVFLSSRPTVFKKVILSFQKHLQPLAEKLHQFRLRLP